MNEWKHQVSAVPHFRVCSFFLPPLSLSLSCRAEPRVHTRAHACLTIMATDQRPSLNIRKPNRWFNPTMDRSFGQYFGQMYYRRQTGGGVGGGWLQNRGRMDSLRPLRVPLSTLKAWVAERNAAFHFPLAFSFENALAPLRFLDASLFLWKFARFWVWIDPGGEGRREREATNDICRVTGWEFGARDAGHFPASMLLPGSVTPS